MQGIMNIIDHTRSNIGGRRTLSPLESGLLFNATEGWAQINAGLGGPLSQALGLQAALYVLQFDVTRAVANRAICTIAD